ncbi:MAG: hypothetical protein BWY52_02487 [Chloroflexi bacterium ADurb.Bin325]|nr:MAG: hypothetical protein BWY52_02487 [Chloroflexi bacterium ADurb.Bin325]
MILKSLLLQPLGPALVLAIAGVLLALMRRLGRGVATWAGAQAIQPARWQPWPYALRLPFALLGVVSAAAVLVWFRRSGAEGMTGWQWQPLTVAGSTLEWRLDGWNWLVSGLILLLAAAALLLDDEYPRPAGQSRSPAAARSRRLDLLGTEVERTLWLAAAALVFVCSANVLTLACSWIVLDAALAIRLRPGLSPEPAGRAWSLLALSAMLVLLLLFFLGESGLRAALTGHAFSRGELTLLWTLGLVRAGAYPLHFWLTGPGSTSRPMRIALSLIAPAAGLWLLVRVYGLGETGWLRRPEWAALGVLALLGTALVAWATEDETWRWRWIVLNRSGLVVMAAYVAGLSGPQALIWALLAFALGGALLLVAQALAQDTGRRAFVWAAAFLVWGFPGAPGFLARTGLVFPTGMALAVPLFVLMLLAEVLFVAALWQTAAAAPARPAQPRPNIIVIQLLLTFGLLAVSLLAWGLAPRLIVGFVALPGDEALRTLGGIIVGARRSVWAGLALSGVLGAALGLFRQRIFGQMRGWQSAIGGIASLDWLYQSIVAGLAVVGNALRYFAVLGEGEGYLGWLALASLILWVLVRG